jgi:hypothetical protein
LYRSVGAALNRRRCCCFSFSTLPTLAAAAVRAAAGPTPIQGRGHAAGASLSSTRNWPSRWRWLPVPYGVPRGAIIDVAPVTDGRIGRDCVVFADFIPDNWSAWPNTFQHIDVSRAARSEPLCEPCAIGARRPSPRFTRSNQTQTSVEIQTTMHNDGNAALPDLLSGLTLVAMEAISSGFPECGVVQGKADGALSDRVVAYDETWSIALHAPTPTISPHGSLDLYQCIRSHPAKAGYSPPGCRLARAGI